MEGERRREAPIAAFWSSLLCSRSHALPANASHYLLLALPGPRVITGATAERMDFSPEVARSSSKTKTHKNAEASPGCPKPEGLGRALLQLALSLSFHWFLSDSRVRESERFISIWGITRGRSRLQTFLSRISHLPKVYD